MKPPLIGITTERADPDPTFGMGGYTVESELYRAVVDAGGIPVALPATGDSVPEYFSALSGIVFSGGGFAMPPEWYRSDNAVSPYQTSPRLDYSLQLLRAAVARSMPVLGICAGMQLIAGQYGARLAADISQHVEEGSLHWRVSDQTTGAHLVSISEGTLLSRLVGVQSLAVNSIHQEAVIEPSDELVISAVAEDGVVEACEVPSLPFCLGLQWHPEHMQENREIHAGVFRGLVEASMVFSQRAVRSAAASN